MRKVPRWAAVLLAIGAGAALLMAWLLRKPGLEVKVARVEVGPVEEIVANTRAGTVKAHRRAKLSPQIPGVVTALPHRKGDRVAAGDLLLQIEDSVQRAALALAENQVRTAEARTREACLAADLAEKELTRGLALRRDGVLSPQALDALQSARDRAAATCQALRAALEEARSQVRLARAQLALTQLRAPFAGIVAECSGEVGEWITPSPTGIPIPAVLDLFDPATLYVSAPIDEVDSQRVKAGMPVRIAVDSHPGQKLAGRLDRVAPYVLDVQEQNRTVEIEVSPLDPWSAQGFLPGTSSDVEVIVARRDGVLRVPTAALAEGGKVLVLAGGRLTERAVQTGLRNWQFTEVLAGLAAGDRVVTVRDSPAIRAGVRARAQAQGQDQAREGP
ncbi:efflux RND transporter periplasmic adaptor subunit [Geothrix alkalitolerans]|uniref:efflux RND transporter periplasmic adaptor subunit n=1 Tax=Geothrix alkalitolerans TaxID=2922724 RepID=UPI001FAF3004|nr:efflux RND transporter periplasmic adaptor subunit [Geothrix alkalitolerans]